jgi:hypothetical protein
MPPADSFPEQNAPDLTPLHLDALLVCRTNQGIQTPLGFLLGFGGAELVAHLLGPARWRRAGKRNDPSSLLLGESRFPSRTRTISQAIDALGIEAGDALPHGLWMAPQFPGDDRGALPLPAADNHPCAGNPIPWGMATAGQLADLLLFFFVLG